MADPPKEPESIFTNEAGTARLGRYEIIRKIGQGASGVVYLGRDPFIKRQVAIKISQPTSDRGRERFFVEAQSAGRLNHPNLVAIYDVGMHGDLCYITMEFVDGNTLEPHCRPENLLLPSKAVELTFSASKALDYAHKMGVIHRDIKPSNIMLDSYGSAKIADFGIAQMTEETSEMGVWGTPSYMSPEQLKDEPITSNTDIFSLGCVLYELLTGTQAFPGNNNFSIMYKVTNDEPVPLREIKPDLPASLVEILKKSMAKDPEERYQTCLDFSYDLRVALRGFTETVADDKVRDALDYVHHVPFFNNFTKEQVTELGLASTIVKFFKNSIIVAEGEIDDTFFIILSGNARIRKNNSDIATIGIGQCFGEMAYISGEPRAASVIADTDCILMKISATLIDGASESIQLLFYKNFATTLVHRLSNRPPAPDPH
jgi:serine/threonine protein kinase